MSKADQKCAIQCFRKCADLPAFLTMAGAFALFQSATKVYTSSVIHSLEKKLGMTRIESGILLGVYDIAFLILSPLAAHFARFSHKPRILGLSAFVAALSGVLLFIPHFINEPEARIVLNTTQELAYGPALCQRHGSNSGESSSGESTAPDHGELDTRSYAFLVSGMALLGVGSAPILSLSLTYLHDNSNWRSSPLYLGILFTLFTSFYSCLLLNNSSRHNCIDYGLMILKC